MISVIIPVVNQHEMTAECLEAVRECTTSYELIVVDNGSDPPVAGATIRNEKNLGFSVAANQAMKQAKGDVVVLLNNDCVVTPGWDDRLAKYLEEFSIVGPMTNYAIGCQRVSAPMYEDKEDLYVVAQDWGEKYKGQVQEVNWLIGFCMMFRRSLLDDIGWLDDSMWPCTGEEIDFCMRARAAGHKVGVVKECYVHHHGSVTFDEMDEQKVIDYQEIVDRNNEHLKQKWEGWDTKQLIGPRLLDTGGVVRLNLGCGLKKLQGYVNIDNREEVEPDFLGDVLEGLPYEDNAVDEVRAAPEDHGDDGATLAPAGLQAHVDVEGDHQPGEEHRDQEHLQRQLGQPVALVDVLQPPPLHRRDLLGSRRWRGLRYGFLGDWLGGFHGRPCATRGPT